MSQQPEGLGSQKTVLPGVSKKAVLLMIYVFPVFFYPLTMLISSALHAPAPGREGLRELLQFVLWMYPLFLVPSAFIFARLWDKNPKAWERAMKIIILIEFACMIAFAVLLGYKPA